MKTGLMLTVAAAAMGAATPAVAATVVDQNAPTNNTVMAEFRQGGLAQSFQQTASNITGAGIYLANYGSGSGTITIGLWNLLPGQGGATQLASGSAFASGGNRWVDVSWNTTSITAGSTYYLVFGSTNGTLGIAGDELNGYKKGMTFANDGYLPYSNFDYTFRTYANDSVPSVPEPATWAMMLIGFGIVGAAMRRVRQVARVNFV